jgi:hypothetical protein
VNGHPIRKFDTEIRCVHSVRGLAKGRNSGSHPTAGVHLMAGIDRELLFGLKVRDAVQPQKAGCGHRAYFGECLLLGDELPFPAALAGTANKGQRSDDPINACHESLALLAWALDDV